MLLRCIRRMVDRPYVVGGLLMIWGYVASWLARREQVEPELARFVRRTQLRLLASLVRPSLSARPSGLDEDSS